MPLVTFDYNDFLDILGYEISKDELIKKLPMIGGDFDKIEGDELSIEFFPNRPDLTSVEGIARASRAFFGFETGIKEYTVKQSDVSITVDPSVKGVRPYVTTALIKNVTMTDRLIASLMEMQEKLHFGLGRNRRKVAIGVHNYEPVEPPFVYKAVDPDSVQFIPLAKDDYMTLREILTKHEKGVDYAHILEGFDKYPLIVDANNNVLSFPPIINGTLTEVTPFTSEIFIDVTGTDQKAINYALHILVTALAERGSTIFQTTIHDKGKTSRAPGLHLIKKSLSVEYVNKILGTNLTEIEIINYLAKMGYNSSDTGNNKLDVLIPAWRADILHEIDLVEDVAVGFGYDQFETDFPKALTFGTPLPHHDLLELLRSSMIGLGFNEVTTFTISNEKDEFTRLGLEKGTMVEIKNPIGEEFSGLRTSLIPSLLKILRENRHHPLPQQIFELGIIVDAEARNRYNLAGIKIDAKANFTESKSLTESVLRDIGSTYSIIEGHHPGFIKGRCGLVEKNEKEVGIFGEVHPKTIQTFDLEHPIIAFEFKVDLLY
jgi:phenylalanyl-tRNA synthetase beta chain